MDIANEDSFISLPLWLGQPEAREGIRPQIHTVATAYFGGFHIARNVGYTEGEGHGPVEDRHEPAVCKHNGPPS